MPEVVGEQRLLDELGVFLGGDLLWLAMADPTDHGVLIHMFDEYLVEDVLESKELAMRFRKAIANAGGGDAAGARKRLKDLGGQMIEIEF